ncbi:MAG TPA: ABC transporter ATP-binding protein [Devosiaceae bacterium]|nr:ABC transporter ATP-binding protein [Devosiaceae bacterium]
MTTSNVPLLSVEDLSVDFLSEAEPVRATRSVSFSVEAGETLVVLGESGSGKSVSANAIMGLIDTPPGLIRSGRLCFKGRDLTTMSRAERRELNGRKIAMIFQDPLAHLNPVYSIGWQFAEVFSEHGVAQGREARERSIKILERVGIEDARARIDQYPHQFSGGQRQRIMIGMAIALEPELLIADEPTTALDVSVQAQILELLKSLQQEEGMGMILITHNLEVAASVGDRIVVMNSGEIVEAGGARSVFEHPSHAYTRQLLAALPHAGEADSDNRRGSVSADKPLLVVEGLNKEYVIAPSLFGRSAKVLHAVKDASFAVRVGETVGIVGESGSGKSTVARLLMRLTEPTSGKALLRGRNIFELQGSELQDMRRRVQMVFQDPFGSLNPRMSVFDIIAEPWQIHSDILPRAKWNDRVSELLALVGMNAGHADRYPHQFSGGQRQRIAIARALASDPELLICDEAVSALDVSIQAQVIDLLADLRERLGLSYIFITHDLPIVRHFADRILVMKSGEIVEENDTSSLFVSPRHQYTRMLLSASPKPKWIEAAE